MKLLILVGIALFAKLTGLQDPVPEDFELAGKGMVIVGTVDVLDFISQAEIHSVLESSRIPFDTEGGLYFSIWVPKSNLQEATSALRARRSLRGFIAYRGTTVPEAVKSQPPYKVLFLRDKNNPRPGSIMNKDNTPAVQRGLNGYFGQPKSRRFTEDQFELILYRTRPMRVKGQTREALELRIYGWKGRVNGIGGELTPVGYQWLPK